MMRTSLNKRAAWLLAAGMLILTIGCNNGDSDGNNNSSTVKDLNEGAVISEHLRPGFREVVIFYANETSNERTVMQHYQRIDAVLDKLQKETKDPIFTRIRTTYNSDRSKFFNQVRKDVTDLQARLCNNQNEYRDSGLAVFTNELARQGKFMLCLPDPYQGKPELLDLDIDLPKELAEDFRYAQNPLSTKYGLRAAMEALGNEMMYHNIPVSDVNYIWISKSHGGSDRFLVPKLIHPVHKLEVPRLKEHFMSVAAQNKVDNLRLFALTYANAAVANMKVGDLKVGDLKVGDLKVGDLKVGDLKVGDLKFGDLKVGDLKVGDLKVGDLKVGDLKHGDLKVGDLKNGDLKVGDLKFGDLKVGDLKFGDLKVGDLKVGDLKHGDLKVGDLKVGDLKVGDLKFGDLKHGDLKNGDLKVGDLKVGDLKHGDLKVGDLKVGDLKVGDLAADDSITDEALPPFVGKRELFDELKYFNGQFALAFFESCNSELPEGMLEQLRSDATEEGPLAAFGQLYTSDKYGLGFSTVDYSKVTQTETKTFGEMLEIALMKAAEAAAKRQAAAKTNGK